MFLKKCVLKKFSKFTEKYLCHTSLKKRFLHRCFPVNFSKFLSTPSFIEHLRWLYLIFTFRVVRKSCNEFKVNI